MSATFRVVTRPQPAWVQQQTPWPARYLAGMLSHTLNHGMPGVRRGAQVLMPLGRRGLPVRPSAVALRNGRARTAPDLEQVIDDVAAAWPHLADASPRLPRERPSLSVLALQRRAGRFVFVFGEGPDPLLVLKPAGADGTDREEAALRRLEPVGLAPRALPPLPGHAVQEGLPGRPVWVRPVRRPGWSGPLVGPVDRLGDRLEAVASLTRAPGRPHRFDAELIEATSVVGPWAAAELRAVARRLATLAHVTLEHRDLNAQNWLVGAGGDLAGVIDWVDARDDGVPGEDVLHLAISMLEHGVALRGWSQEQVVTAFRQAWRSEPLFDRARHWHRRCVAAATGDAALAEPLVAAHLAGRLVRRIGGDGPMMLTETTTEQMLEVVLDRRRG